MRDFPEKVIIEMGADQPGDIKFLANLFRPQKGIILTVLPVHLAEFKTVEAVAEEKSELAKSLPLNGMLFLNSDDQKVRAMGEKTKAQIFYFGEGAGQGFFASKVKADLEGLSFMLNTPEGERVPIFAPVYGEHMLYSLLAAISVAIKENISSKRIQAAAAKLKPFKGRMNVLDGTKGSIIIDDSYNANPESMLRALGFLSKVKGRKIALLGTMNELGSFEKEGHEMVGREASKVADILVTVGETAEKYLASAAESVGMSKEKIKTFSNSEEAGDYLKRIIRENDVILAKGSQNKVRIEKAVAKILKDPSKAKDLLARQGDFWK